MTETICRYDFYCRQLRKIEDSFCIAREKILNEYTDGDGNVNLPSDATDDQVETVLSGLTEAGEVAQDNGCAQLEQFEAASVFIKETILIQK